MPPPACLITPKGEVIELSPAVYRKIRRLIDTRHRKPVTAKFIRSTYGKYRGKGLMKALMAEKEREKEF
jgi:hypothetical protein